MPVVSSYWEHKNNILNTWNYGFCPQLYDFNIGDPDKLDIVVRLTKEIVIPMLKN